MPKTRRVIKKGLKSNPVHVSFKLGNRKVSRSAHRITNEELLKEYQSSSIRPRDRSKIAHVLRSRNVALPSAEVTVNEAQ